MDGADLLCAGHIATNAFTAGITCRRRSGAEPARLEAGTSANADIADLVLWLDRGDITAWNVKLRALPRMPWRRAGRSRRPAAQRRGRTMQTRRACGGLLRRGGGPALRRRRRRSRCCRAPAMALQAACRHSCRLLAELLVGGISIGLVHWHLRGAGARVGVAHGVQVCHAAFPEELRAHTQGDRTRLCHVRFRGLVGGFTGLPGTKASEVHDSRYIFVCGFYQGSKA